MVVKIEGLIIGKCVYVDSSVIQVVFDVVLQFGYRVEYMGYIIYCVYNVVVESV